VQKNKSGAITWDRELRKLSTRGPKNCPDGGGRAAPDCIRPATFSTF